VGYFAAQDQDLAANEDGDDGQNVPDGCQEGVPERNKLNRSSPNLL
jgi:hypothetical protein